MLKQPEDHLEAKERAFQTWFLYQKERKEKNHGTPK
jgi:hypothetical protein